jgi:hypothetical protein
MIIEVLWILLEQKLITKRHGKHLTIQKPYRKIKQSIVSIQRTRFFWKVPITLIKKNWLNRKQLLKYIKQFKSQKECLCDGSLIIMKSTMIRGLRFKLGKDLFYLQKCLFVMIVGSLLKTCIV